ncbi:hypothetical protein [Streptomyces sp. NPDC002172]
MALLFGFAVPAAADTHCAPAGRAPGRALLESVGSDSRDLAL